MVGLQLTRDDAEALARTLEWSLSEMRMEIADTENLEFREGIKRDKHALERVLAMLRADVPA